MTNIKGRRLKVKNRETTGYPINRAKKLEELKNNRPNKTKRKTQKASIKV